MLSCDELVLTSANRVSPLAVILLASYLLYRSLIVIPLYKSLKGLLLLDPDTFRYRAYQ